MEEGLQRRVSVQRDKGNDTSGGWGISEDTHAAVVRPGEDEGRRDDTTSASPSLPPPSPVTRAYTPPPTSPKRKESDWGTYGTSPTFSVLPLPQPTNTASRDDGWGGDEEWQPEAVREAMPTFGSSFAGGDKVVEEEVEEGWGGERKWEGEQEVPQVSESVDRWEPQEQRSTRGKSIVSFLSHQQELILTRWVHPARCVGRRPQTHVARLCQLDLACPSRLVGHRCLHCSAQRVSSISSPKRWSS